MGNDPAALARCVGDVDAFLAERWGRRPHRHRSPDGYADLLSIDDVDRIVSASGLRTPAFRLVRGGETLPAASYTRRARIGSRPVTDLADAGRVFALFDEGATIVLQGLQRSWPPLARFCRELETVLTHPVQANAYVTPPVATGLRVHADAHDVFALQTFGRKQWITYTAGDVADLDLALEPGDSLYIPQGVRHAARTVDQPSVHITIGVRAVSWEQVLRDALDGALAVALDDTGRGSLPPGFANDPAAITGAVADRLAALAKQIESLDAPRVAEAAAERFLAERPPLLTGQLRQLLAVGDLDDGTTVVRRPGTFCRVGPPEDGVVRVMLGDRALRLPARVEPALRWVAERNRFTVRDLAGYLDEESRRVLVARLVREALLLIES
ncbi:MAG TPA: cupin domain-containing protein [Egibacteraceae bacterium]|nr:cupin domain-containing protein [Egibacteraceae bacterium]